MFTTANVLAAWQRNMFSQRIQFHEAGLAKSIEVTNRLEQQIHNAMNRIVASAEEHRVADVERVNRIMNAQSNLEKKLEKISREKLQIAGLKMMKQQLWKIVIAQMRDCVQVWSRNVKEEPEEVVAPSPSLMEEMVLPLNQFVADIGAYFVSAA